MNLIKLSVLMLCVLLSVTSAFGQTQPNLENGYKAYGSYDGSNIDTINTMNGNLMLHLPMPFSYPQRGGKINPLNLLTISSKNWSVQCDPGCHWTLGHGIGGLVAEVGTGVGFDDTMDLSVHRTTTTVSDSYSVKYDALAYYLTTADGAHHRLVDSDNAAYDSNYDAMSYDVADLSGYHVDLNTATAANGIPSEGVVIDRNGNRYAISFSISRCSKPVFDNNLNGNTSTTTCVQASRTRSITDVNGNVFTPGMGLSDTMGRPFSSFTGTTSTTDYTGCVSNTWPLASASTNNYASANGTTSQFKLCYANVNIQTAFGSTVPGGSSGSISVTEAQNGPGVTQPYLLPMLVTMVMPDGTSWKFDYDSYGNVTHLGLPSGGAIHYSWTTIASADCYGTSRAVATRTISDNNGHSWRWLYNWGASINNVMTNTVTDPLGNDTVHVFTALNGSCSYFYETSTREYQGPVSAAQLLKQVDTTYQTTFGGEVFFVFANSYKTTVYPSGKVKLVQRTPDPGIGPGQPTLGLVTQELEYDWGQGAPGPLLRETDTVYQWQKDSRYLAAHLIDLPASVVVVDPTSASNTKPVCQVDSAGTTKACAAETDYAYDEDGYLQSYETANGPLPTGTHVASPNVVRGNLTSVSRWLNTAGAMITSHTKWFDTGMVYQSIDPLNHASTQFYDLFYAGAYPTKTCDALNHCVSGTYDITTGLLTSFTNQNATSAAVGNTPGEAAHTVRYGYDTLSRITVASFSDGGQVSFNYSPPNTFPISVEKVKKINAVLDDHSFVYLDGLGRPFKGVHRTPAGDATVITTYDPFDRSINVTNPFVSTSDPTYGELKSQYDALGRTTQITKQDGSFSTAVYNQSGSVSTGDCTTTADEAGKVRRVCSDALGRMVEVDEPGDSFAGSKASGILTVGGTLLPKTIPGANAFASTATITIQGSEHSKTVFEPPPKCTTQQKLAGLCDQTGSSNIVFDQGTVSIAVNGGAPYTSNFTGGSSTSTIANDLAGKINNPNSPNPYVSASVVNSSSTSSTITLTARTAGKTGNNIGFTTSYSWDTADFPSPTYTSSFVPSPNNGTLNGGTDGTSASTVTDSGTTKATITNQSGTTIFTTAAVSYGGTSSNNNAAQVATALAGALNADGSPVTASSDGTGNISVAYKTVGTAGNVTLAVTSSSAQSAYFPAGSFSGSSTLNNGSDPQGPSLNHPYVTQYAYDVLGNLTCVVQKGSDTTPFTSCAAAPATWRPRSFTYDSLSRLLTATNPESGTITYNYDDAGNLLQKTSPAANQTGSAVTTISICYDALNRPTGKAYSAQTCQSGQLPAGTAAITYTYDAGTNGLGQLSGLSDQAGSASYSYDALGRLTVEQRTTSGINKSVSYEYNLDGSLRVIHYPSGAAVTYTPDSAGRTLSATDIANGINYVAGATYAPDNSITGFINGNSGTFAGITNAFTYNKRLQPVNISALTPSQQKVFAIGYDFHVGNGTTGSDNGNVWGITNFKDSSRSETFSYDALNRLASTQTTGTDCTVTLVDGHTKNWGDTYSYDAWGNLLSKTSTKCGGENVAGTMNMKNQPLGYSIGGGATVNYSFDAAGNLVNDGALTCNYDAENRLTGANGFTYAYDADGNRVKKSNGTTGTLYWYAAVGVIAETDLAGNNAKEYIFFNGTRVARKDSNGQVYYYFSDFLKTTSVITDSVGNLRAESDYDPWGVERRVLDSFNNTYKFTGKERDGETGLDYFGARYYSNALGRFITPDWAAKAAAVPYANYGNPQSLNLYSYVQNNPATLADRDGHQQDKENKKANVAPQKSNGTINGPDASFSGTATKTDVKISGEANLFHNATPDEGGSSGAATETKIGTVSGSVNCGLSGCGAEGKVAMSTFSINTSSSPNPQAAKETGQVKGEVFGLTTKVSDQGVKMQANAVSLGSTNKVGPLNVKSSFNVGAGGQVEVGHHSFSIGLTIGVGVNLTVSWGDTPIVQKSGSTK